MEILETRNLPYRQRIYNACLNETAEGFRLFYRHGTYTCGWTDDGISTCLLTKDRKVIPNTNKQVKLPSSCKGLKNVTFLDGHHVEDPRVVPYQDGWIMGFTDGYRYFVAKLDAECNVIFSHQLNSPAVKFNGGDGREKNWLPFIHEDEICFWYSDYPRTILHYKDTGDHLELIKTNISDQRFTTKYGRVRGGCSPVKYDETKFIWFFHTLYKDVYHIGAYITEGLFDVVGITEDYVYKGSRIVFPCGAVKDADGWTISCGIEDRKIGFYKVRNLSFVPISDVTNTPVTKSKSWYMPSGSSYNKFLFSSRVLQAEPPMVTSAVKGRKWFSPSNSRKVIA